MVSKKTRLLAFWLSLCLLTACLTQAVLYGMADAVSTGTVINIDKGSYLNVREGPGSSYASVGRLYNGDVVTIHKTVTDKGGKRWCHITKDKLTGYASAEYIEVNAEYETDKEFEAYLTAQGFPEDYKVALRKIHAEFPSWVFRAEHLSMTWATALREESKVGRNTITRPDSWKSMESGAYDWKKNEYVSFDSGGWVSAAPALIAYYMDPRNFLSKTYLFQFEDLHFSDGQTVAGIQAILPDKLDKHATDLLNAARAANVSAYHLATRIRQEGTVNNGLGTGTVPGYEGYYNFFDIGAYAHSGNGAVTNGAIYAKNKGWDTPKKCLDESAKIIGGSYINREQDTIYYQKYNFTNTESGLYRHQYMTNTRGAADEGQIRFRNAQAAELKSKIVFTIPVFKDMPDKPAPRPSESGNNNNFLDKLTVSHSGGSLQLTPTFDRYTHTYSLQVGKDITEVTITPTRNYDKATVTGGGKVKLNPGENVFPIKVKATSGEVRTYTLTITREGPAEKLPTITGKVYKVDKIITKVEPETAVSTFIKNLAVKDGVGKVYTAAGKEKTSGPVATGDILRLYSGSTLCASYPVVIYGDVNGDGKITSLDLRVAQKHILGMQKIDGYALTAADSGKDGQLSSLDLRITQKYILGITKTLQ